MLATLSAGALLGQLISAFSGAHVGWLPYLDSLDLIDDEIVRVGALRLRAERRLVRYEQWDSLVEMSRYGAVRSVASYFFEEAFEFERAEKSAATPAEPVDELNTAMFNAQLSSDLDAQIDIAGRLFLVTGNVDTLFLASAMAEVRHGRLEAAAWTARTLALFPDNKQAAERLLLLLADAEASEHLRAYADALTASKLGGAIVAVARASLALLSEDPKGALDALDAARPGALSPPRASAMLAARVMRLRGQALDRLRDYRAAAEAFLETGRRMSDRKDEIAHYRIKIEAAGRFVGSGETLPLDSHAVTIVGFPGSGAELLGRSLGEHPLIESLEAVPGLEAALSYLQRNAEEPAAETTESSAVRSEAVRRFREEAQRRRRKASATCVAAIAPERMGYAQILNGLGPEQRYLLVVRHPLDLAVNWVKREAPLTKGMPQPNALEEFVALYDLVMERWFNTFKRDDPRVLEVRYERLLSDPSGTLKAAAGIFGLPWEGAKLAAGLLTEKGSKTESTWRDYLFLFRTAEAKPLLKWAEFLGYEAK